MSHRELVFETARMMLWLCLYTALTAIIGFASLAFGGIRPVIDFGWMMTLGLCVTFLTSFLLFPNILVLLHKPKDTCPEKAEVSFYRCPGKYNGKTRWQGSVRSTAHGCCQHLWYYKIEG